MRSAAAGFYQRAKMLTHHALDMLRRRTGLMKGRQAMLIAPSY
jgi:hypothetical protein